MTVSKQIIEVLEYLAEKVGVTVDWTDKNILPYVKELCTKYVKWETATSIMWLVFGIILIIIGLIMVKNFNLIENPDDIMSIIVFPLIVIGIITTIYQINDILTCIYFPEKMLYNEIQSLISNK